jgi:UDP-sugar pyrophosphorylase
MLVLPWENFSTEQKQLVTWLLELGQDHIFSECQNIDDIQKLVRQLEEADRVLSPGGLRDYILRGRRLLSESRVGRNPFDGCCVSVPSGV